MTFNFTQPSGGDWFKPAEHPGNLILITKVHEIGTKYDNMAARDKDFAVIDFVDLDEPNPQLRQHVSDNHPGIVNKLAKSFRTGELVLGRINQIPSDKGNPAWILGPFVPGVDDVRAGGWMTVNPLNSFGQPANRPAAAPAQQYAPPPQPVQQQQYAPQPQQQDPQGFGQYTSPQTQQAPAPQYAPAPVPQPVQQQPQYAPAAQSPAPAQQQYAPQPQAPAQQYQQQAPQAPAPQYAPAPQQQYAQAPAQQPQQGPPPAYDPNNLPPGVADLVNQLSPQQPQQ